MTPFERLPALMRAITSCVAASKHVDGVGVLGGDVGAAAVGQEADAARAVADLDRLHHLAVRDVDDVDASRPPRR